MKPGKALLYWCEKGGIGKTSLSCITAYELTEKYKHFHNDGGYKTLLIDFDPQANATQMMTQTYGKEMAPLQTFYQGLLNGSLADSICHLNDNLDMIPAQDDLADFVSKVAGMNEASRDDMLNRALKKVRYDYDYIIIDVPPTLNTIVRNAIHVDDINISCILQSQRFAYNSLLKSIASLGDMQDEARFNFVGIILYLYNHAKIDKEIAREAKKNFRDGMFQSKIVYQERIKLFSSEGINLRDFWSIRALNNYQDVIQELLRKIR